MSEKPEALRLAAVAIFERSITWQSQATIELRRLSAVETQRDALLEALKEVVAFTGAHGGPYAKARAAIAAAEEEGK